MPNTKLNKKLEQEKKDDYYSKLMPEINFRDFLKKSIKDCIAGRDKKAQPALNLTPIKGAPAEAAAPAPAPEVPVTPPTAVATPGGPAPGGDLPPIPGGAPGEPAPISPMDMPASGPDDFSRADKENMLKTIEDIKDQLRTVMDDTKIAIMKDKIIEEVQEHYKKLEQDLQSLKDRKIPERKFYDTEGTYREHLYGMAARMLDEVLPDLFEEIPEYSFTATQVSRIYDDGTVANALVTLMARVIKNGMKYDFKVDVPVLNGLMQYPMYIQRGNKLVPLTKAEVQEELGTLSYRKEDVEIPYSDNTAMFTPKSENIHKRKDNQKWYNVIPNSYKPAVLPPDHQYQTQKGINTR